METHGKINNEGGNASSNDGGRATRQLTTTKTATNWLTIVTATHQFITITATH